MGSEWIEIPFSEAVLINPPVRLERGKHYPFVDMSAVSAGSRFAYATEKREFSGSGSRFQHGDTLMARITPCLENGKIARFYASTETMLAHGSTEFIVIRGRTDITVTDFVYYLTKWEEVRSYAISQMTGTSGRQRVPADALSHLIVPIPPLPVQRAIAHILGTMDDKIELNRRMNETLEEMARALFKSWFVDFEPVRAKIDGRWRQGQSLPGLPAHLYDLFPDSFVDSELGEIPKGWEVGAVQDFGQVICGKTPPTTDRDNYGSDVPFVTIPDMHGKVFVTTTEKKLSKKGAETQKGKFLPPFSICVSCIATPGLVALTSKLCQTNQQINSVIPSDSNTSIFCFYALRGLGERIRSHGAGGSVLLNLNKGVFSSMKLLLPPREAYVFQNIAKPMLEKVLSNENEIETLAALRNTLLPKLISGELRVKDAEKFLKERGL